ncbi:GIY-YIG nuclease family protein [Vulcanisaeta sp. JCM 14467]|uniref:GIY-YIG nuclease family protein n=1 Tax=Vulcanisaeta sp. JCM 14467 TaxID=1295370 RepID=UPI0006D2BFA6|nr:GIY-YIG nuclease family protein [Vulcanisaeta sp. JCM 14467]
MSNTEITETRIREAVTQCLNYVGIPIDKCLLRIYNCKNVSNAHYAGVYVFFDESTIYYVGETDDIARRLSREHCAVHIGGSEGVVRFLMYYLDHICDLRAEWERLSVRDREEFVKGVLRRLIHGLGIFVVMCDDLKDETHGGKMVRSKLEECLIEKLNPALNPIKG